MLRSWKNNLLLFSVKKKKWSGLASEYWLLWFYQKKGSHR